MIVAAGHWSNPCGHRFRREPHLPCWTLAFVLRGTLRLQFARERAVVTTGSLLLVAPNTPYRLEALEPVEELSAIFAPRPDYLPLLAWPPLVDGARLLPVEGSGQEDAIEHALREMVAAVVSPWPDRMLFAENALEKALLLAHLMNTQQRQYRLDDRMRQVLHFIDRHFAEAVTVQRLAALALLSPSHFAHLFRRQMGYSPMEFVELRRMREAEHLLLATNNTIADIAETCGFPNPFHFSTRFRKHAGQSPRKFREKPQKLIG